MYIVAIAWMFVVLLMAATEATSTQGSVLGALITFVLYGLVPLSIVLYIMGAPARRKARRAQVSHDLAQRGAQNSAISPKSEAPDGGGMPASDPVSPEREKP